VTAGGYAARTMFSARSVFLALFLTAFGSTAFAEQAAPKPVMVFAIAWDKQCGGNSLAYATELVDSSNYNKAREALKKSMEAKYPKATRVSAGSSKFEFGPDAGAVSVIEIDTSTRDCTSKAITIHFGVDEADAAARAAKAAGKRAYKTLEQKYFVKVTTAR
jgi:hypothetical protein